MNKMHLFGMIEKSALLVLDDLFILGLDSKKRAILLDIIEDRHGRKSMIITSQIPVDGWYDAIGDPTIADAIIDRIAHTAHRIELSGESMRTRKKKKKSLITVKNDPSKMTTLVC